MRPDSGCVCTATVLQWRRNRGGRGGRGPPNHKVGGAWPPNPNPIIKYKSMRRSVALICAATRARPALQKLIQYSALHCSYHTDHSTCVCLNSCSCCKYEVDSVIFYCPSQRHQHFSIHSRTSESVQEFSSSRSLIAGGRKMFVNT